MLCLQHPYQNPLMTQKRLNSLTEKWQLYVILGYHSKTLMDGWINQSMDGWINQLINEETCGKINTGYLESNIQTYISCK